MNRPDLCLEFVNTRFWRGQAEPTETLKAPEDLAAWTAANGGPRPGKPPARREFERAVELRETLHRLFDAEAQDKAPAARDLAALNEARVGCSGEDPARAARQAADRQDELPMADVAERAAFASLRRFNAVFAEVYKRTLSEVRRLRFKPV